jgi:carbon monoxide dehydrogenase subunit G
MPDSFRHEAVTAAPRSRVWQRLQNPATWATVAGVDGTSDHAYSGENLDGFRFRAVVGGIPYQGTARVTDSEPESAMTMSIRSSELHGTIEVALYDEEGGTRLHVEMNVRPAGLLGPMVFPMISRSVGAGFPGSVERLAAEMD